MNRIEKKFSELKRKKEKALVFFMTAGDPNFRRNEELACAFEKAGVDLIELGVPFSDPLADGPVIQASSQRSLSRGTTLDGILRLVKKIRKKSQIPLLLMTYYNPVFRYGLPRFAARARAAGVDGLIVPDLPPEEGRELAHALRKRKIDLVFLLAPTSTAKRRRDVLHASKGFVYYVSLTGVTGSNRRWQDSIFEQLKSAKRESRIPICVGFGISKPRDAARMAKFSDGVIVGSALVRAIDGHKNLSAEAFSKRFVRPFARALGKGQ